MRIRQHARTWFCYTYSSELYTCRNYVCRASSTCIVRRIPFVAVRCIKNNLQLILFPTKILSNFTKLLYKHPTITKAPFQPGNEYLFFLFLFYFIKRYANCKLFHKGGDHYFLMHILCKFLLSVLLYWPDDIRHCYMKGISLVSLSFSTFCSHTCEPL